MKTTELKRKMDAYLKLDGVCDVGLLVAALCTMTCMMALEQDRISMMATLAIFAATLVVVAALFLLKKVAYVQITTLSSRLTRREAWEENRNLFHLTTAELESDFRRYFGCASMPETTRGRMIDRLPLLGDDDSVNDAVDEWLYQSQFPHIRCEGVAWFSDDGKTWKAAEPEVLKGEVIIFERVVREDV